MEASSTLGTYYFQHVANTLSVYFKQCGINTALSKCKTRIYEHFEH